VGRFVAVRELDSVLLPALLGLSSLWVCSGCERELPGPEDCERVALRMLGIQDPRVLELRQVKKRFDQVVVDCLTTPYDRQLIRCIDETGQSRACLLSFRARLTSGDRDVDPRPPTLPGR
jgi:hypothetical protein